MSDKTRGGHAQGITAFLPPALVQRMAGRIDDITRLRALWRRVVPAPLCNHTEPLRYEAGALTVRANSPAWGSRLRQQEDDIARRLRAEPMLAALRAITVRVTPPDAAPAPVAQARHGGPPKPSAAAAGLLRDLAEHVKDPNLRDSLLRLAARCVPSKR